MKSDAEFTFPLKKKIKILAQEHTPSPIISKLTAPNQEIPPNSTNLRRK